MGYAFISYSSKNQSSADALRALFTKNGIRSWMAPNDIPAGSKYAQVINQALKNCACLVLLLTEDAQNSQWVAKEVERAINYRKTIITLQLENIILNDEFEFYLSNGQIIAAQKIDEASAEIEKVLTSVITYAGQEQATAKSTARSVPLQQQLIPEIEIIRKRKQYKGRLTPDTLTGTGTITYKNGAVYTGSIQNGVEHGKGKYVYAHGDIYEGDFVDGDFTGKGKYIQSEGYIYEGDWIDGKRTGKGKFTYPNGAVYEGDFVDGKFTGKGKLTHTNGNVYEGDFVDGKRTGNGRFTKSDGTVQIGRFQDGKYLGPA